MNFGGPVWHCSVAPYPKGTLPPTKLRKLALRQLEGVGDPTQQFHEWTGYAWHVRRRLTPDEEKLVGPVVDCRGTDEWTKRLKAVRHVLPEAALQLALEERFA
jgi:hypothetical protein